MRIVALVSALLLVSCTSLASFTHSDHIACGRRGKPYSVKPEVYLHLGTAPQVCATRSGFAEITVFVNLYNLPAQEVRFTFNDKLTVLMFGKDITLVLRKVRVGEHYVVVSTDGYHDVRLSFSVWDCGA